MSNIYTVENVSIYWLNCFPVTKGGGGKTKNTLLLVTAMGLTFCLTLWLSSLESGKQKLFSEFTKLKCRLDWLFHDRPQENSTCKWFRLILPTRLSRKRNIYFSDVPLNIAYYMVRRSKSSCNHTKKYQIWISCMWSSIYWHLMFLFPKTSYESS